MNHEKFVLLFVITSLLILPIMGSSQTEPSVNRIEFSVKASGGMGFTHDEYSGVFVKGGISYLYDNRGWTTPNLIKLRNLDLNSVLSGFDFSDAESWTISKNESILIYDAVTYSIQVKLELDNGKAVSLDYRGELFQDVMNCNRPNVCHFILQFPNLVLNTYSQKAVVFANPFSIITITLIVISVLFAYKTRQNTITQDPLLQKIKKGFLLFVLANFSFTIQTSILGTASDLYPFVALIITINFIPWIVRKKLVPKDDPPLIQ